MIYYRFILVLFRFHKTDSHFSRKRKEITIQYSVQPNTTMYICTVTCQLFPVFLFSRFLLLSLYFFNHLSAFFSRKLLKISSVRGSPGLNIFITNYYFFNLIIHLRARLYYEPCYEYFMYRRYASRILISFQVTQLLLIEI